MTETAALNAAVAKLPPVQLAELQGDASLLSRRERKYLVPINVATSLVAALSGSAFALEIDGDRAFHYQSVYFDTPEEVSYLATARRRRHAFKVRTRAYIESGDCVLEVKLRGSRGRTIKSRLDYPTTSSGKLTASGRTFVQQILGADHVAELQPTLTTTYRRFTLLLSGDARLTIDTDFRAETPAGAQVGLDGFAIIESKSRSAPTGADHALWRMGFRPIRLSKFGTSLAALDPARPSNRWTRALRSSWSGRRMQSSALT